MLGDVGMLLSMIASRREKTGAEKATLARQYSRSPCDVRYRQEGPSAKYYKIERKHPKWGNLSHLSDQCLAGAADLAIHHGLATLIRQTYRQKMRTECKTTPLSTPLPNAARHSLSRRRRAIDSHARHLGRQQTSWDK